MSDITSFEWMNMFKGTKGDVTLNHQLNMYQNVGDCRNRVLFLWQYINKNIEKDENNSM